MSDLKEYKKVYKYLDTPDVHVLFLIGCVCVENKNKVYKLLENSNLCTFDGSVVSLKNWNDDVREYVCKDIINKDGARSFLQSFNMYIGFRFPGYSCESFDFIECVSFTFKRSVCLILGVDYNKKGILGYYPVLDDSVFDENIQAKVAAFFLFGMQEFDRVDSIARVFAMNRNLFVGSKVGIVAESLIESVERLIFDFDTTDEVILDEIKRYFENNGHDRCLSKQE